MAVTELALLHLSPSAHLSPSLQTTLQHAQKAQTSFSTHQVTLFTQDSDPAYIYIYLLGGWDSIEQHYDEWIPSSTNQELLRCIADEDEGVDVEWMVHVGVEPGDVREVVESSTRRLCIVWGFVRDEKKSVFEGVFGEMQHRLSERTGTTGVVGGWRVEKGREAFVMFSGLEGFAESAELEALKEVLEEVQVCRMRRWIG